MFNLPAGYWTDDGSMAMCIMDSYVRKGGYDVKDIGDTFVKWFMDGYLSSKGGESFDVGGATWNACQNIAFRHEYVNGHVKIIKKLTITPRARVPSATPGGFALSDWPVVRVSAGG